MYKIIVVILLVLNSCAHSEKPVYELPEDALAIISADSSRTWKLAKRFNDGTRMNMGECFLAYRQTFANDSTMKDNAGDKRDCGETLFAEWKFIKDKKGNSYLQLKSDQIPALMQIEEDFKFFKVLQLSEEVLVLEYRHKQYGNKSRTITDHYVPENVEVEDRDFHW
jgi:hypothetical protein